MKPLKFKNATPHGYCELAVSKDKNRGSISHVYRAHDSLLGTDGHRLHRVSQPRIETPHSLGGSGDTFPDVSFLDTSRDLLCEFHASSDLLEHLKAVIAVAGKQPPFATLTFSAEEKKATGTLEVVEGKVTTFSRTVSFSLGHVEIYRNATFSLNLRYLVEAILWDGNGAWVKIFIGKEGEAVKVENAKHFEAFLMPVRIPKRA